jgi:hypothetical protein
MDLPGEEGEDMEEPLACGVKGGEIERDENGRAGKGANNQLAAKAWIMVLCGQRRHWVTSVCCVICVLPHS